MEGKFNLSTHLPTEAEKRLFGIFISHSNKEYDNGFLNQLSEAMIANHLNPIYDRDFLEGGQYFQDRIEQCLNCYAGVVIVTENSLRSDWVNYEIGYFSGLGMPIVLWDPDDVLSLEHADNDLLNNSHISQYLPAQRTVDDVLRVLREMSIYAEIFKDEFNELTKDVFREILNTRVETVMVRLESEIFDSNALDFKGCRIGTLIVNFGMFHPDNGDGQHCMALRNNPELPDRKCPVSGGECALYAAKELDGHNLECVVLNYTFENGRFYPKGTLGPEGEPLKHGCINFYVPVHKVFGTEFKFIVDATSNAQHYKLIELFESMGMNPTVSDSLNGRRIYLSLPERPRQGFFRLVHQFSNNFLCPYSTREK